MAVNEAERVHQKSTTAVGLWHLAVAEAVLPDATPKPTSRSGQLEATLGVWQSASTGTGVWECGPGEFTADRSQQMEVCTVLSGSATVTGLGGDVAVVGAGSLLVLPAGWQGTWVIEETVRKTYVLIVAAAAT